MPSGPADFYFIFLLFFVQTWLKSDRILRGSTTNLEPGSACVIDCSRPTLLHSRILCIKPEKEIIELICFPQFITCCKALSVCCHVGSSFNGDSEFF